MVAKMPVAFLAVPNTTALALTKFVTLFPRCQSVTLTAATKVTVMIKIYRFIIFYKYFLS